MRMREPGGNADLPIEPLGAVGAPKLRAQHFYRNPAIVFPIHREVHDGMSAHTELALDDVQGLEGGAKSFGLQLGKRHGRGPAGSGRNIN